MARKRRVDPQHDVPDITQEELKEYEAGVEFARRIEKLRQSIIERLYAGATVERGRLAAFLEFQNSKHLYWKQIEQVIGRAQAAYLKANYVGPLQRRLRIQDRAGQRLAWEKDDSSATSEHFGQDQYPGSF